MIGSLRYTPTSYQKKLYEMDYNKHMQRLETIQNRGKKLAAVNQKEKVWRKTFSESRAKHLEFQSNEKVNSIDRNNQALLNKLVEISRKPKIHIMSSPKSAQVHPGTLNTFYRKRELERIALENESFARRLISQQGSFNRRKLDTDFERHQANVKLVQKVESPQNPKKIGMGSPKLKGKEFHIKKKKIQANKTEGDLEKLQKKTSRELADSQNGRDSNGLDKSKEIELNPSQENVGQEDKNGQSHNHVKESVKSVKKIDSENNHEQGGDGTQSKGSMNHGIAQSSKKLQDENNEENAKKGKVETTERVSQEIKEGVEKQEENDEKLDEQIGEENKEKVEDKKATSLAALGMVHNLKN